MKKITALVSEVVIDDQTRADAIIPFDPAVAVDPEPQQSHTDDESDDDADDDDDDDDPEVNDHSAKHVVDKSHRDDQFREFLKSLPLHRQVALTHVQPSRASQPLTDHHEVQQPLARHDESDDESQEALRIAKSSKPMPTGSTTKLQNDNAHHAQPLTNTKHHEHSRTMDTVMCDHYAHLTGHHAVTTRFKRKMNEEKQAKAIEKAKSTPAKVTNATPPTTPTKPRHSPTSSSSPKQRASQSVGTKTAKSALRNRIYSAAYHKMRTQTLKEGHSPETAKALVTHVM